MVRFAGINFDHMHMGDLLRHVSEHPDAELVGICNEKPERMRETANKDTYHDYSDIFDIKDPKNVTLYFYGYDIDD